MSLDLRFKAIKRLHQHPIPRTRMLLHFVSLNHRCTKPLLWLKGIGNLSNIVCHRDEKKLSVNLFKAAEVEFTKTYNLLDMTENRFNNHLALGVDSLAIERI